MQRNFSNIVTWMGYFSSTTNRNKQSQQFPQYGFQSVCMGNFLITFPPCMGALLKIQNRHLTITRFQIRLMFCCSSIENVFTLCFSNSSKKKETQMLKFIHIHLYMHFIVIGNVSCMCVFFALFLTFFFSWMLCCYNSHSGTYSHLHCCSHSFNRSGDNERKWQESTESYAFSS